MNLFASAQSTGHNDRRVRLGLEIALPGDMISAHLHDYRACYFNLLKIYYKISMVVCVNLLHQRF